MKKILLVAALALVVSAGAATAKTYQPLTGKDGGYQTEQTEPNRYVVVYTGARGVKKNVVGQYALLRAAEVTLESGNEWFAVISSTTQEVDLNSVTNALTSGGSFIGGGPAASGGTGVAAGGGGGAMVDGGGTFGGFGGGGAPYQAMERWRPVNVQQTILIIQVGSGDGASFPGAVSTPEIFDAKATEAEIRATIKK